MMDDLEVGLKQNEDSMVGLKVCRSAVRLSQQQAQLALEESPPMQQICSTRRPRPKQEDEPSERIYSEEDRPVIIENID